MTPELARAVQLYLARSPARLLLIQPEDVLGQIEQVNLPGTTDQYPNWRHKLPLNLEEWTEDPRITALVTALQKTWGKSISQPVPSAEPAQLPAAAARIPLATYRLQFNRNFTFIQATELIPYLHTLGISHCYASPYLKARPGSLHGYDIIDHNALNPEIGSLEDFERFVTALQQHGMGQLLDIVPNHMGVMGSDNSWWLDVLENGQASSYADFFDIDWEPLKNELRGKLLVPVLGDQYGTVLERGELKLMFDSQQGEFSIWYYAHRFPVDPTTYPQIIGYRLERLAARLDADHPQVLEFQSLVTAFGHLPSHTETAPDKVAERNRDKEIYKRHLAVLCTDSPDIAQFIEENVKEINGTAGDPKSFDWLHELIGAQAYRLAYWRVAADDINYRRFFDINDLAAVRMEKEAVFTATHRLMFEWIATDKVDGLRIDHPDGLCDPAQYFQRLQQRRAELGKTNGEDKPLYVVVEKIRASYEHIPKDWAIHGGTGYRFANLVNGLFVDSANQSRLDRLYAGFLGEHLDFDELLYRCKQLIMKVALTSELNVLANQLSRLAQADRHTCDFTLNSLRDALTEIVACFPVYRTYLTDEHITSQDQRFVNWAVATAKKRSQAADITVFDFVHAALLLTLAEGKSPAFRAAVAAFAMKFQQFTSPVMAKSLEDTSFYIYNRLVSLNDVGGDPKRFGISVAAFHSANQERMKSWPHTLLNTSTHDSKRSEDVRARLNVLSEIPARWRLALRRWSRLNRSRKHQVDGQYAPSRNDEYLLYQTLLGAWPVGELDQEALAAFCQRVEHYLIKAVREAKVHSSWINPNSAYEEAMVAFIRALLLTPYPRNLFLADFTPLQAWIARLGLFNSLSQTLLKLTVPGVPDIYQGCELWQFHLVDPDNRRPVDFARRQALLQELQTLAATPTEALADAVRRLLDTLEDGRSKLYLTWKALELRNHQPQLFQQGSYLPLRVAGTQTDHLCAFARQSREQTVIVAVPRLYVSLLGDQAPAPLGPAVWGDTQVELPSAWSGTPYRNMLTGEHLLPVQEGERVCLPVSALLASFPVALLCSS
jgi:(1->4)-alpha-D-glucan 1-alpha-D-glucosylmutase